MTTASMEVASSRLTWSGRLASCRPTTSSTSQWYKSDAVPGPDLLAGDALVRGRRTVGLVAVHPGEELPLGVGVAPGVHAGRSMMRGLPDCGAVMASSMPLRLRPRSVGQTEYRAC